MSSLRSHKSLVLQKIEGKPGQVWYPLHVRAIDTPSPTSSQLLLRPTHLALNHRDLFLRQHLYPSPSFTTPLLSDACCVVLSPATGTPTTQPASRVLLNPGYGWIADPSAPETGAYRILGGTTVNDVGTAQELIVCEQEEVVPCPSHLSGAEAAALPLVGLTAWRALVTKSGNCEKGRNILVTGIGGGVALMVLLFATKMGMKVWVTSGDEGKIEKAKGLGAAGGVNYKEQGWEKKLKAMLPRERPLLDTVIDGAGGDIVDRAVRILKLGGTIVSYGMTLGPKVSFPMSAVLKNIDIRGSTMGSRQEFRDMVSFVNKEEIRPVVSRVVGGGFENLEGVESLFEDMKAGKQFGKLVIAMNSGEKSRL